MIALVAVLALGFLSLNVVAYRHAYTMLHFSGKQRTGRPEQLSLAEKTKVLLWGVQIPRPQTKTSPLELGPETNPVQYAADVKCPILFLHGAADPRARIEEARRVSAAVPGFRQFKEFADIGHQAAVVRYPEEWKTAVKQFLKEAENAPPQTSGPKL